MKVVFERIRYGWESIKQNVKEWYGKTARLFLFCNMLLYLGCCVVAQGPVGPVGYIHFLYHCCQWSAKG